MPAPGIKIASRSRSNAAMTAVVRRTLVPCAGAEARENARSQRLATGLVVAVAAIAATTAILLSAPRDRARGLARRRLPARRPPRRLDLGRSGSALLTAFASAAAFNFFHIPPTGEFTIADAENWVALGRLLRRGAVRRRPRAARAPAGRGGGAAPARGRPRRRDGAPAAPRRRPRGGARDCRPAACPRPSASPGRRSSSASSRPRERRLTFPLREGPRQLATLLVTRRHRRSPRYGDSRSASSPPSRRCSRPRSSAMSCSATGSRRPRCAEPTCSRPPFCAAVSHDLRSPLTAIRAAAEPLRTGQARPRGARRRWPRS